MSRRIGIAGLIWTVALLASRVTGLVRDAALGSMLGIGPAADAYAAAFRIPDAVNYVISGGALSIVFIPMFTSFLEKGEEERAWRAFSLVANFIVGLAAIAVPLTWWFTPELARWLAPGFDPEQTALLVRLTRIVLPAQLFHLLSGLLGAALLARDKHAVPALAPLLYNVAIIAGGLLTGTAEGFAWGVLVGAFAGPFLLPLIACLRVGLRWSTRLSLTDPDFRTYIVRALPIMLAFTVSGFDDTVWTWFASRQSPGDVALLSYAKKLMMVPIGVFGMAMGMAAYPTISRLCVTGATGEAYRTILRATRLTLLLALGSQVVLTVAGPEAGTLVYGTARIPPERMTELGVCLGVFSLALGAWSAQTLLARGFYARNRTWLPVGIGAAALIVALPFYAWFGQLWGAPGLAAASSLGMSLYVVGLAIALRREIGEGPGYAAFLARALPATAVGIAVGWVVRDLLPPPTWTRLDAFVRAIVLSVAGGGAFALACWAFGLPELRDLVGQVRRRVSPAR